MYVKIRTPDFHLSLPVPTSLAGAAVSLVPSRVFAEMAAQVPEPYRCLVTKENIRGIVQQCLEVLRENKGLEVVHVEARDGTFVSVKL